MKIRRIVQVGLIAMCLGQVGPVASAWGGGGCHRAGLSATEGTGTTVSMVEACFTPTILRVAPGDSVTFVNRDSMTHNVTANDWGHWDDLYAGDRFTATFDDVGIYPFACTYHPGMSGAIVVGDGAAPDAVAVTAAAGGAEPPGPSNGWLVSGIVGLSIGIACGIGFSRRRRREPASAPVGA